MTQPGKELAAAAVTGELLPAAAAAVDGELIPAGDDPLGLYERSWECMVCGAVRLYDDILVAARPIAGLEDMFQPGSRGFARANVKYCRGRATCAAAATVQAPWPTPAPVLQAGLQVLLTAAGCRDRIWAARDERVGNDLARMVLQHLAAQPATTLEVLVAEHCAAAPDLMFDTVRRLVQLGAVEVTEPAIAIEAAA